MEISFGIPVVSNIDANSDEAFVKLYFKNQINVRNSVYSYSISSLVADIGGYLGLLLGFSLLDISGIVIKKSYSSYCWATSHLYSIQPLKHKNKEELDAQFVNKSHQQLVRK